MLYLFAHCLPNSTQASQLMPKSIGLPSHDYTMLAAATKKEKYVFSSPQPWNISAPETIPGAPCSYPWNLDVTIAPVPSYKPTTHTETYPVASATFGRRWFFGMSWCVPVNWLIHYWLTNMAQIYIIAKQALQRMSECCKNRPRNTWKTDLGCKMSTVGFRYSWRKIEMAA